METVKKIAKYVVNTLAIINALLIGIAPIWGYDVSQITETVSVIMAVISTYLLGQKAVNSISETHTTED